MNEEYTIILTNYLYYSKFYLGITFLFLVVFFLFVCLLSIITCNSIYLTYYYISVKFYYTKHNPKLDVLQYPYPGDDIECLFTYLQQRVIQNLLKIFKVIECREALKNYISKS